MLAIMAMDFYAGCNVKWWEMFKFHWVQQIIWERTLYGSLYGWIPFLYNLIGWVHKNLTARVAAVRQKKTEGIRGRIRDASANIFIWKPLQSST